MNEYKEHTLNKINSNLQNYKLKHEQIKFFNYKNVIYIMSRDYISNFEWLYNFITLDQIVIDRTNKDEIYRSYKTIIIFLNYIRDLYIDFYTKENGIDNTDKAFVLRFCTRNKTIPIPHILYPEFEFDKWIYHRNSYLFTEEDIKQTKNIIKKFETFYYTLLNRMEEYEYMIRENTKDRDVYIQNDNELDIDPKDQSIMSDFYASVVEMINNEIETDDDKSQKSVD